MYPSLHKNGTTVFVIIIVQFLEEQIIILEWFLKDHVTLNTAVMAAENSALSSQEYIIIQNIKNKTVISQFVILFQNIPVFTVFLIQ